MAWSKDNPHVENGRAKRGEMEKAFKFERAKELERRKTLPKAEVEKLERAEQALANRMAMTNEPFKPSGMGI